MTPFIPNAGYQAIVLSGNAFLWLGLSSLISAAVTPSPEMHWIDDVTPQGLLRLQTLLRNTLVGQNWLYLRMPRGSATLTPACATSGSGWSQITSLLRS